jgi:5-methylcytosine-specific restriction endonuclease McrA
MRKIYFTDEERRQGKCRARRKSYRAHRDKVLQKNARYQKAHAEKIRSQKQDASRKLLAKFSTLKARCRKRGLEIVLTLDEFAALNALPCEYCEGVLPATGYGLDRKDNNLGYTRDNSVPCCYRCNTMKGAYLTHAEMKLIWENRRKDNFYGTE